MSLSQYLHLLLRWDLWINITSCVYNYEQRGKYARTISRKVAWQNPNMNYVELNVDEIKIRNRRVFLKCFFNSVGVSNMLHAKFMSLFYELQIYWKAGYKKVFCYSYSKHVIQLVQELSIHHHYGNEMAIIMGYMHQD
ncbi:hypothetical protein CR513_07260, partial [Mucuna pruriens]